MSKTRKTLLFGILVTLVFASPPLEAARIFHITGGGQGTFASDLDTDGDIDGSHFGMGIDILDGGMAQGHFTCLMAGNKDFLGLRLMLVEGQVTAGTVDPAGGSGSFSGSGTLHIDSERLDVTFIVDILDDGGPGVAMFQLTVIDPSGTVGTVAFPPETVETGQIMIH